MYPPHELHIERLEAVSGGSDEVEAGVHPAVRHLGASSTLGKLEGVADPL